MSGENGTMSHISVFFFFFEGIPITNFSQILPRFMFELKLFHLVYIPNPAITKCRPAEPQLVKLIAST